VCCVLFERGVLFYVMCVICVLCLIVVPLPPGENPFVVKINNNNIIKLNSISLHANITPLMEGPYIMFHKNVLSDEKYIIMPLIKMTLKINLKIKLTRCNAEFK
jgi:hypothetical protein